MVSDVRTARGTTQSKQSMKNKTYVKILVLVWVKTVCVPIVFVNDMKQTR